MSQIYNRTFKVPTWIILSEKGRMGRVLRWLDDAGALFVPWPANNFSETIEYMKGRGWRHELTGKYPFILNPQLLGTAVVEHVKRMSEKAYPNFDVPLHKYNRKVESTADFPRLFNDWLSTQPSIYLSNLFQIADRCNPEAAKYYKAFVSMEPCQRDIISKVAERVITIGDAEGFDITIQNVQNEDIEEYLATKFSEINKPR